MIPWCPRIQRFASVAPALALLHGCAAPTVAVPPPRSTPPAPASIVRTGVVVAAAQGRQDRDAEAMALEIARRTGFGVVRAGEGPQPPGAHEQRVLEAARGPLRLYAEILARDQAPCTGPIEIGTVGVDREQALRLRALAELIRDAHLRASPEIQRLDVLVEPADAVTHSAAGRDGLLRRPRQALQIELPRCARRDFREAYTAILADFLAQAAQLSNGR
jgi:hypothetical protein